MNKFFVVKFLSFSIKTFFTKLFVIVAPNNSLELALTLFAEPVAKEKG